MIFLLVALLILQAVHLAKVILTKKDKSRAVLGSVAALFASGVILYFSYPALVRQDEVSKMARFVNDKYGLNFSAQDCIYYREKDNRKHLDYFGHGRTYNIPYIAVFEDGDRQITVADRKGFISDNGQLGELNYMIGDYFSKMIGGRVDYVQVRAAMNGNLPDDTINRVLQYKFNEKVTENNVDRFLDEVFEEENLELLFYMRDVEDRDELLNETIPKLSYLQNYPTIERVIVYLYDKDEDVVVHSIRKEFGDDPDHSDDNYDDYKFGYYYVPNEFELFYPDYGDRYKKEERNHFVASAWLDLDRGYGPGQGNRDYEVVEDWYVYTYE